MRYPDLALLTASLSLFAGCATAPAGAPPAAATTVPGAGAALAAFSNAPAPAVKPDLVVAADGSGDFKTVEAAVASIPKGNHERKIILVKDGVYHEKVRIDANDVTLIGQSRQGTRIEFAQTIVQARTAKDNLGQGVVNVNGDDCVLQNLTVHNTSNQVAIHAFAIYGRGDRTVITDSNVWSAGNDTLSLWRTSDGMFSEDASAHTNPNGRYYHARLDVCGTVDFICPRGWCYMVDSNIHEMNPNNGASVWEDGNRDKSMKFVLRDCRFDGVPFVLARHHHDAQLYFLDCWFSSTMINQAPKRVIYPLNGGKPTPEDIQNNKEHDPTNIWGERFYYYNSHRDGGDYAWFQDNLGTAAGAPSPAQVTAAWTFNGQWDPENQRGPAVQKVEPRGSQIAVTFGENVTVKGQPRLALKGGGAADYVSGSGSRTLLFAASAAGGSAADKLDLTTGAIVATEAAATLRMAGPDLP